MKIFAIGDLHLSSSGEKPMDVFGPEWSNHAEKIAANWRKTVTEEDLVLLPGDLSWSMRLSDALPDLRLIESLPGEKVFIRGNHDYWFDGPAKVRAAMGPRMRLLRFDACVVGGVGICGVRGWTWPGNTEYNPENDEKHWRREVSRLELSLRALAELSWDVAIAMFHYPPLDMQGASEMCGMIHRANVRHAVYGHMHGASLAVALEGERDGITWRCVSADKIDFTPALLFEHSPSA